MKTPSSKDPQAQAETKHTPGPWRIGEEPNHPENSSFGIEGGPLGLVIADINEDAYSDDEQAANARLIAAAPELLDALKAIYICGSIREAEKIAIEAYAKATGELP